MPSIHASARAVAAVAKHLPNPAQQAKAADPTVSGSAFGAMVSSIAKAKHEPAAPPAATPLLDGAGALIDLIA
jgi:hypothetical protein